MWMLFAIAFALAGFADLVVTHTEHLTATMHVARATDDASSIGVIAQAVDVYRQTNPSATGAIGAASLPVPAWYQAPAGSGVVLQGGFAYVFLSPESTDRAARMVATLASRGFVVGIASGGSLRTPGGDVVAAAPTTLPAGSVAIVQ